MGLVLVIVPTDHAVHRYRRRHRAPRATRDDVTEVIAGGIFRVTAPHGVDLADVHEHAGYVVAGAAVFPLREDPDGSVVAVTCLKAHRRSKADRRAFREAQRELYV